LLTAIVVLGVANVARWSPERTPRFVVQRVHRDLSLLVLVFIAIHIATVVIDGFAPIRWVDAVVPFGSAYRPIWLGFGALAFDLLLAIAITSLLRARLGYTLWRAIHWTTYGTWVVAVLHGAGVGSDTSTPWMLGLVGVSVGSVLAAAVWRIARGWDGWEPARVLLVVGAVLMPPALAVWMVTVRCEEGGRACRHADRSAGRRRRDRFRTVRRRDRPSSASRLLWLGEPRPRLDRRSRDAVHVGADVGSGAALAQHPARWEQEPEGFSVRSGTIRLIPPQGAATYRVRSRGWTKARSGRDSRTATAT
jgi:sulfoxide reductase heme-binding subunit YedZ